MSEYTNNSSYVKFPAEKEVMIMIKAIFLSVVALVLSVGLLSVTYAQTTETPTTTVTPSPAQTTVPQGAPSTGFGK